MRGGYYKYASGGGMEKQKPGKRPRSLLQKTRRFLVVVCSAAVICAALYFGTGYIAAWQLKSRSVEVPGVQLYSVQGLHYTHAYSWYTSYPKIDEPAFDGAVAKIANDAKGAFLARVDLDAPTKQPASDLNVSYVVDKTTNGAVSVRVIVHQVLGNKHKEYAKAVSYDKSSRQLTVNDAKPEDRTDVPVNKHNGTPQARSDVDCDKQKCVALTFDGGPSYVTPQLLDTLKAAKAKATFFELGSQAALYPTVAKRTVDEGHNLGNGTYTHRNLLVLSPTDAKNEVERGAEAIKAASGEWPEFVRAPYGAATGAMAKQMDESFIEWSVDSEDWKAVRADEVYRKVMSQVKPGAIIAAHDSFQITADAYGRIIPDLVKQGYKLVTVAELLGDVPPGIYKSR